MLNEMIATVAFMAPAGRVSAGDSQPMDVCSVHHDNSFLRYCVSLLGYGFYGDVLRHSERNRRLGPARYDLAGTSAPVHRQNLRNQRPQRDRVERKETEA